MVKLIKIMLILFINIADVMMINGIGIKMPKII